MSSVNFMEKLLDGVAVEWRTLKEITSIKTGQAVNKGVWGAMEPKTNVRKISTHFIE